MAWRGAFFDSGQRDTLSFAGWGFHLMPQDQPSRPPAPICPDCAEPMRIASAERDKDNINLRRVIYVCNTCGRTSRVRTFGLPSDSEKCEAKAAEFRLLAARTADPFVRKAYFELAEELEYLSAYFKALDDRKPGGEGH